MTMNRRPRPPGRPQEDGWTQVCMTIVTIGAAVAAAVLVFSGLGSERPDPMPTATILKEAAAVATLVWYGALVLVAIRTVFQPDNLTDAVRAQRRRRGTHTVFSTLGAMVLALAGAAMVTITTPTELLWESDRSKTIRINQESRERLEIAEPEELETRPRPRKEHKEKHKK